MHLNTILIVVQNDMQPDYLTILSKKQSLLTDLELIRSDSNLSWAQSSLVLHAHLKNIVLPFVALIGHKINSLRVETEYRFEVAKISIYLRNCILDCLPSLIRFVLDLYAG